MSVTARKLNILLQKIGYYRNAALQHCVLTLGLNILS